MSAFHSSLGFKHRIQWLNPVPALERVRGGGSVESRKVLIQLVESDIRDLAKVKVEGPEKPSDKV